MAKQIPNLQYIPVALLILEALCRCKLDFAWCKITFHAGLGKWNWWLLPCRWSRKIALERSISESRSGCVYKYCNHNLGLLHALLFLRMVDFWLSLLCKAPCQDDWREWIDATEHLSRNKCPREEIALHKSKKCPLFFQRTSVYWCQKWADINTSQEASYSISSLSTLQQQSVSHTCWATSLQHGHKPL